MSKKVVKNLLGLKVLTSSYVKNAGLSVNQLLTHLPDEVIYTNHNRTLPYLSKFQGVLMFLDISGFTALCERYSMNVKNGTDELTKTLNAYMGALVQEILDHDGDIYKYAGDAILTMWRVEGFAEMKKGVMHVMRCALSIQKKYNQWNTGVGVKLRVKIGIAAGETTICFIGNKDFCHYVGCGRAVDAVNKAEKFCESGDIVISPTAFCHLMASEIEHTVLSDKKHVLLNSDIAIFPNVDYKMQCMVPTSGSCNNLLSQALSQKKGSSDRVSKETKVEKKLFSRGSKDAKVRVAIVEKLSQHTTQKLRLYVAIPVLRKMDEGQPLEYLSEMRQVTIVFINMATADISKSEQCLLLQSAFSIIYDHLKRMQGVLNKIFMFDKGCTYLGIFGLPGFKNEKDCAHALQSSYSMRQELASMKYITGASIGVTTGSTYCGVVGHSHRHEYTVIGRKVNMAARLMMHYPGKVTCDNETFHHSKLSKDKFTVLEIKQMKGLQNIGSIREYNERQSVTEANMGNSTPSFSSQMDGRRDVDVPLIGRQKEFDRFHEEMEVILSNADRASQRQVIIYEGDSGIGKTRIFNSIINSVETSIKVVICSPTMHDSKTPFFTVKNLLMDLLNFDFEGTAHDREQILYNTFKDQFILKNLSMLNDLCHLKLPLNDHMKNMDNDTRTQFLHKLLYSIVHEMCLKIGYVMFAVDDAHFMDPESWELVNDLGQDMSSLVLLTLRTSEQMNWCRAAEEVFSKRTTLHIPLGSLQPKDLEELACQMLDVVEIPKELVVLLRERSNGVPSWCEQLLSEMYFEQILLIVPVTKKERVRELKPDELELPVANLRQRRLSRAIGAPDPKIIKVQMVCVVAPNKSLEKGIPDSIKGMIQARIDRMSEKDQMVIKCAAICGLCFSRAMLQAIIPEITTEKVQISIVRLMEQDIFECEYRHRMMNCVMEHGTKTDPAAPDLLKKRSCLCPGNEMGIVENCQNLRFHSPSMQETAYEMFVENVRQGLHVTAAHFLEAQAHRCEPCGGGSFLTRLQTTDGTTPKLSMTEGRIDKPVALASIARVLAGGSRFPATPPKSSDTTGPQSTENSPRRTYAPEAGGLSGSQNDTTDCSSGLSDKKKIQFSKKIHKTSVPEKKSQVEENSPDAGAEAKDNADASLSILEKAEGIVESLDVPQCRCIHILANVYPHLVRHWRAAGDIEKTIHFLMEAAGASLALYDNLQALSYLNEVKRFLEAIKIGENPFQGEVTQTSEYTIDKWEEIKLESLIGQALYHMSREDEAMPYFLNALRVLGNPQPRTHFGYTLRLIKEQWTQWKHIHFPDKFLGSANLLLTQRLTEQCRSLSHMFHQFVTHNKLTKALVTALQHVNCAETSNNDLYELIIAYTCMMQICLLKNWRNKALEYESKAHLRCMTKLSANPENLSIMSHLYVTSLNMRLTWGCIPEACDVGFVADRITKKTYDNDLRLALLPVLAHTLLLANRSTYCIEVLADLNTIQEETSDILGRLWYYSICLDLVLDTGYQLESLAECVTFAEQKLDSQMGLVYHDAIYYLSSCFALWYMRKQRYGRSEHWQRQATEYAPVRFNSYFTVCALAKVLEIKLIDLATLAAGNNKSVTKARKRLIRKDLDELKKICVKMPVFTPRHLHLEAYLNAIEGKLSKAFSKLQRCIAISTKMGNMLEMSWAKHSETVWHEEKQHDLWKEEMAETMSWHMANQTEDQCIKYSLPLPGWIG